MIPRFLVKTKLLSLNTTHLSIISISVLFRRLVVAAYPSGDMSYNVSQKTLRLCGLCVFYLIYLFIGAAIFSAIEYSNEKGLIEQLKTKRHQFLQQNKKCLNDSELEAFIARIIQANSRGISAIDNLRVEPNWSFGQAVFFSGTVLTTIGYGHVSPLSPVGKIFCIIFALFGIPLTLVMISACVERLLIVSNNIYERMKKMDIFLATNTTTNMSLLTYTHLWFVFTFVLVLFFLVPAAVFSSIEPDWGYLDALYYCFISLTTIGLGDFIPGDHEHQSFKTIYKIGTTFYLITGIMFVMLLLNVVTQIPQLNLAKLFSLQIDSADPERQLLAEVSTNTATYSRHMEDKIDRPEF